MISERAKISNILRNFHQNTPHPDADNDDIDAAIDAISRVFPRSAVVKIPTSKDEAEAMEKMGFSYLKTHAPERLTAEGFARPVPAEATFSASELRNILAIMSSLDQHEIEGERYEMAPESWEKFRSDPYSFFLRANDDTREVIMQAIIKRTGK